MVEVRHRKQIDEGVAASLREAGIRARYHKRDLSGDYGALGQRLADWVLTGSKSAEGRGRGFTFIGNADMEDLAILTARGMHITARRARVVGLAGIEMALESSDYDRIGDLFASDCLLVTGFGAHAKEKEAPYAPRMVRRMEYLVSQHLADRRVLLLHSDTPLDGCWWSSRLLQRVAGVNDTITQADLVQSRRQEQTSS